MYNPFSLNEKQIIVTGASSGIGRQCAIDCSKMGAKVVLIARNEDRLKETLSMMEGKGHSSYIYDFTNPSGIKELVSKIVDENGKFDGFVHAAGIEMTKLVKSLKPEDYTMVMQVNTISGLELARHITSAKCFNPLGSVVFIASITSIIARVATAAYSASKGALVSASRVMAIELAKRNIRVNCISPGTVITPLIEKFLSTLTEEQYAERVSGFPLGVGQPSDISSACIYLLSDGARWLTGQNIVIDGGFTSL